MDKPNLATADDVSGWADYPIEQVIKGSPGARVKLLRTSSPRTPVHRVALISAEPSTFCYRFEYDEAFQLIRGHAVITLDTGERLELRSGDVACVPAGHDSIFEILEPSVKFVVVSGAT
jgi:uncharacterized cupin superfamily protein